MSNRIKEEFLQKSEPVRLNKYLSEAGVCSRREADRLIETGRVTVDGQRAQTGMRIVPGQVVKLEISCLKTGRDDRAGSK